MANFGGMANLRHTALLLAVAFLVVGANAATVYQTAKSAGLTSLVAALDATGQKKLLNNPNFKGTVFAPTNDAFDAAAAAANTTVAALLKDKRGLTAILNYHIIPDDVLYKKKLDSISNWGTNLDSDAQLVLYKTANNALKVYYGDSSSSPKSIVFAGRASVIKADVKADKAVVQVIDAVLIPPV